MRVFSKSEFALLLVDFREALDISKRLSCARPGWRVRGVTARDFASLDFLDQCSSLPSNIGLEDWCI